MSGMNKQSTYKNCRIYRRSFKTENAPWNVCLFAKLVNLNPTLSRISVFVNFVRKPHSRPCSNSCKTLNLGRLQYSTQYFVNKMSLCYYSKRLSTQIQLYVAVITASKFSNLFQVGVDFVIGTHMHFIMVGVLNGSFWWTLRTRIWVPSGIQESIAWTES